MISNEQRDFILQTIRKEFPDSKVLAFGSRIRGDGHPYSDLDLAIDDGQPLPLYKLSHIEEALAESDIPFKVDLLDFHMVDADFQAIILSQGKFW